MNSLSISQCDDNDETAARNKAGMAHQLFMVHDKIK